MTERLYNEPSLLVYPSLATAFGLNEAIILQQVHYWTQINKNAGKNYVNGRYWVYRTYADWEKEFPFWCGSTIRNTINRLEKQGILLSGNYNKMPMDKTKWYTINYDEFYRRMAEYEDGQNKQ